MRAEGRQESGESQEEADQESPSHKGEKKCDPNTNTPDGTGCLLPALPAELLEQELPNEFEQVRIRDSVSEAPTTFPTIASGRNAGTKHSVFPKFLHPLSRTTTHTAVHGPERANETLTARELLMKRFKPEQFPLSVIIRKVRRIVLIWDVSGATPKRFSCESLVIED
jgi:hypothetical protein